MSGEKTEKPTPKRLKKAFEDGDILKSTELAAALVVLGGCFWLSFMGPALMAACKEVMTASFRFDRAAVEDFQPWRPLLEAGWRLLPSLASLFALTLVGAIASTAALGSLKWNAKQLAPKGSRLNPGSGLKRIFGAQGWIELGKSLLKVLLLGIIGYWTLQSAAHQSMGLVSSDVHGAIGSLGGTLLTLLFTMAAGLLLIAGIDVPIAMLRRMKRLRMSKQDLRDEHKQQEGSPEAKGAIRARQREVLKRGFRKALVEADVVLTNPTHFAVALRYDRGRDQVPVVVAKGRGATALAIRELAAEMTLPVLEYPTLARAVYYTSREGQEVRDDLYLAIATVLAFVFRLNTEAGGSAAPPPITVPDTARFDENGRSPQPA